MHPLYFITGIDTDAGKSIVTGVLGKYLLSKKVHVITQKMAQTGTVGISEDIITHRRLMNIELTDADKQGITCPYVFPFPAAPQLSARLENESIDLNRITESSEQLKKMYDTVLLEGVGGLMVPIVNDIMVIDYLEQQKYPTIVVSNGKLGSINHTLLALEALKRREIEVVCLIYNRCIETDPVITEDTLGLFRRQLTTLYPSACLIEFPFWDEKSELIDCSPLFGL